MSEIFVMHLLFLLKQGDARFVSVVYRLFKLRKDEPRERRQATYNGTIDGFPDSIKVLL